MKSSGRPQVSMPQIIHKLPISPAFSALSAETSAGCLPLLGGVAGTHALLLDASDGPAPLSAGLGRWTVLRLAPGGSLEGPLRALPAALPFSDASFSTVIIRYLAGAGVSPDHLLGEAARVLASHGLLLVIELHPRSLWRPWLLRHARSHDSTLQTVAPRHWRNALRIHGLASRGLQRCGAPWPREAGSVGLPRWLVKLAGAAYLLKARKQADAPIVQRLKTRSARASRQHAPWAHGAQRVQSERHGG